METRVVNLYKEEYDVYIGRAGKGKSGYYGNPFSALNREESISKYKEYFFDKIENDEFFREKIMSLKGKTLGCFCKPKSCHGDVIVEFLEGV